MGFFDGLGDFFTGSQDPIRQDGSFDPTAYRRMKGWDAIGDLSSGLVAYGMGQPAQAAQAWSKIGQQSDPAERMKLQQAGATFAADQQWNATKQLAARSAFGKGGPPMEAAQYLRQNPHLREQFDQWYGAGSAYRVLGGQ